MTGCLQAGGSHALLHGQSHHALQDRSLHSGARGLDCESAHPQLHRARDHAPAQVSRQNRVVEVGGRGLAVGAGHRRGRQPFGGMVIDLGRQGTGHGPRIISDQHGRLRAGSTNHIRPVLIGDHRDCAGRDRLGRELRAVTSETGQSDEKLTAADIRGIDADAIGGEGLGHLGSGGRAQREASSEVPHSYWSTAVRTQRGGRLVRVVAHGSSIYRGRKVTAYTVGTCRGPRSSKATPW